MPAIGTHDRGVTVALQVQTRASRTEIVGSEPDWLRMRVAAPPVDGAANAEIIAWLSKQLKVPRASVEFLSGERGRRKVLLIVGMTVEDVQVALRLI